MTDANPRAAKRRKVLRERESYTDDECSDYTNETWNVNVSDQSLPGHASKINPTANRSAAKRLKLWRDREMKVHKYVVENSSDDSAQKFSNLSDTSLTSHDSNAGNVNETSSSDSELENENMTDHQYSDILQNESDSVSNSDESLSDCNHDLLQVQLAQWAISHGIADKAINELLIILQKEGLDIPKDCRTLKCTPKVVNIEQKCGGEYLYLGLEAGIKKILSENNEFCENSTSIKLFTNVDGINLHKSTHLQMWPVLCAFEDFEPFVVLVYCGRNKPNDVNEYLQQFLDDYRNLQINGLLYNNKRFQVCIVAFICDAPARSFLKLVISHTGYYACERCQIEGGRANCVVLHSTDEICPCRTEDAFRDQVYVDHQIGRTPLLDCNISCIKGFPLEYMHLVCLGVVKRIIYFWKGGPKSGRSRCALSAGNLQIISCSLLRVSGKMPSEFSRQPRCINEFDKWKATEFRQFLLYTGPVVLRGVLSEEMYSHFLTLSVAMSILLTEDDTKRNQYLEYANSLISYFVNKSVSLYGKNFPVYNVHCLTHICDDAENYQCSLNKLSAFRFENHLRILKKHIRGRKKPLVQLAKRLSERESLGLTSKSKTLKLHISGKLNKDSCFKLGNKYIFVQHIHNDGDAVCKVLHERFTENFFENPCESQLIGVVFISHVNMRQQSDIDVINKSQLKQKFVHLPYKNGLVLFPLLHAL